MHVLMMLITAGTNLPHGAVCSEAALRQDHKVAVAIHCLQAEQSELLSSQSSYYQYRHHHTINIGIIILEGVREFTIQKISTLFRKDFPAWEDFRKTGHFRGQNTSENLVVRPWRAATRSLTQVFLERR